MSALPRALATSAQQPPPCSQQETHRQAPPVPVSNSHPHHGTTGLPAQALLAPAAPQQIPLHRLDAFPELALFTPTCKCSCQYKADCAHRCCNGDTWLKRRRDKHEREVRRAVMAPPPNRPPPVPAPASLQDDTVLATELLSQRAKTDHNLMDLLKTIGSYNVIEEQMQTFRCLMDEAMAFVRQNRSPLNPGLPTLDAAIGAYMQQPFASSSWGHVQYGTPALTGPFQEWQGGYGSYTNGHMEYQSGYPISYMPQMNYPVNYAQQPTAYNHHQSFGTFAYYPQAAQQPQPQNWYNVQNVVGSTSNTGLIPVALETGVNRGSGSCNPAQMHAPIPPSTTQTPPGILQPVDSRFVPQKRPMSSEPGPSKKPRSSEVLVIDLSDDEGPAPMLLPKWSQTMPLIERKAQQAITTKAVDDKMKAERKAEKKAARKKHAQATAAAKSTVTAAEPADATAPTPSIVFTYSDEMRFRLLAKGLQQKRPDRFKGQELDVVVDSLKRSFSKHCSDMPRNEVFKFMEKRVCGTAVKVESAQQPIAASNMSNIKPVAAKDMEVMYPSTPAKVPAKQALPTPPASSPAVAVSMQAPFIPKSTEPELCQEQSNLVDLILSGRNVFYTGSAGCGKSTVLKAFVARLKERGKNVRILAPTGRAALDINGSTTWTFAGWTPNHMKRPIRDLEKDAHGKFVSKRLRDVDVLVIDEISMVENLHFERLSRIMKTARGNDRAFGGVQLVVTGDFCQLPPCKPFQFCMECGRELRIINSGSAYKCPQHGEYLDENKWAFASRAWTEADFEHVHLAKIHRQSDKVFIKILQKLRIGTTLTEKDRTTLLEHKCDTTNAMRLFATNQEVKRINDAEFARLQTRKLQFQCLDHFSWNRDHRHLERHNLRQGDGSLLALRDHRLDPLLELKEGMLVVLLVNLEIACGLVNGTQGKIIGFKSYAKDDVPKAMSTLKREARKSGSKRDDVVGPVGIPTLGGDYAELREMQIKTFIDKAEVKEWPIVRFDNGITRTIYAECRVNECGDEKPYSLLMRTQIPLVPAWAMTIHKSQGMTLNKVVVDLARSFESGQEYVALSRARSLEGLKVESLGRNLSSGDEQVKNFLATKFGIR